MSDGNERLQIGCAENINDLLCVALPGLPAKGSMKTNCAARYSGPPSEQKQ
jgi:hypothetical protein